MRSGECSNIFINTVYNTIATPARNTCDGCSPTYAVVKTTKAFMSEIRSMMNMILILALVKLSGDKFSALFTDQLKKGNWVCIIQLPRYHIILALL
jgi:hypothetical protein